MIVKSLWKNLQIIYIIMALLFVGKQQGENIILLKIYLLQNCWPISRQKNKRIPLNVIFGI